MSKSTHIIVRGQYEGVHCFPEAPDKVAFLRNPHRHIFHYEVEMEVFHDDRELEFILLKRDVELFVINQQWPERVSCEQMARNIGQWLQMEYGFDRFLAVSVFEDNENGAKVYM